MKIVTRAEWGFDGWLNPKDPPNTVNERTQRTEFFTHYNGPATGYKTGVGVPRSIHRIHKGNGWKGIGYGHVVTNDGTIYEGRGFGLQGSHCPDHNVSGYSAQVYIGVGETPSPAALTAVRWLYDEAQRRAGRTLAKKGHRDGTATACPGDVLYRWVRNGMTATTPTSPEEDDMPLTETDINKVADEIWTRPVVDHTGERVPVGVAMGVLIRESHAAFELTKALALKGSALTADEVKAVVAEVLDAKIADSTTVLGVKVEGLVQ